MPLAVAPVARCIARRRLADVSTSSSLPTTRMPELLANTLAAAKSMDYPADKVDVWLLDDGGTLQKRNSDQDRRSAGCNGAPRAAAAAVRRTRRALSDARPQRTCQGRQSQQRHAAFNGRTDRRLRCRPCAGARFSAARRSAISTRIRVCSWSRRRISSSIRIPIERNLHTFDKMPSENEMFYGIIQRGLDKWNAVVLLRFGGGPAAQGAGGDQRLQRPQHHRGLRDRDRAPFARLAQHLCRQAADRGPAAGDLRQLHRPAQPLGAGHDADPAFPLSALEARPLAPAAPLLHVIDAVLAVSRSRARSS